MKRLIFAILALFLLTIPASAADYYVESDYDTTVPVNVSASSSSYLLVDLENGFSPTTEVYLIFDSGTHGDISTDYTWISSEFVEPQNISLAFDYTIGGTASTIQYGLANTSSLSDSIYMESNVYSTDYAKAVAKVSGTPEQTTMRNDDYGIGSFTININDTAAEYIADSYPGEAVAISTLSSNNLAPFIHVVGTGASGSGEISNIVVRQYYDNAPTVTVSHFGQDIALVEIANPNDFALNDYQVTFDLDFVDQTDESINITAYSSLDVPVPTYPIDNENLVYAYPPVVNEVNLTWTGNGGNTYSYEVRDIGGTLVASGSTSNTYAIVEIPEGSYYWTVESDLTETMDTLQAYFTVSNTYITDGTTAVVGTVYHMENFVKTPIGEAVVYISNDTFSDHETVGPDGYFSFIGLAANTTYYLKASATDYDTSEVALVTPTGGETTVKDLLLVAETKYYENHKVKFVVQTIWGSVYPGVDVKVYKTGSVNALYSGTTGTDGSITFEMDEEVEYRITFDNSTLGIDEEITIYPMSSLYNIYPTAEDVERESDNIKFGAIGSSINLTAGYINASFLDTSGTTTLAELWINETDGTNLYYFSTTNSNATWSQVVAANNTTYLVHFELQNTELADTFLQDRVISFNDGVTGPFNFGFTEQWHYQLLGTAMILFVGLLFGAVNAQMGAVVVVLLGWFNVYTGWYPSNVKTILMLMLATLVAIGFYLRKGEDIR